jgi:hypothetical protein
LLEEMEQARLDGSSVYRLLRMRGSEKEVEKRFGKRVLP